jgi:hypothetical protein
MHPSHPLTLGALCVLLTSGAHAANWSDTSIGWRTGSAYAEPFGSNDINKNIINLTHVSGDKWGGNFFNVDLLLSDSKDPSDLGSKDGAHEAYVVYRRDFNTGLKFAGTRGLVATVGFDYNTKTDVGYNSKKRMFVAGPTLQLDVPGFLNIGALLLWESNQPSGWAFPPNAAPVRYSVDRYSYDVHPMLTAAWGIPLGATNFAFEGFANFIASKGKDEFGGGTKPELNIDAQIMYDASGAFGAAKNSFKVGVEYQYWRNKFGNNHKGPAGDGAFAKTPMLRVEYHF